MNETEQLYQEIFRDYRGKGWTRWEGHFVAKANSKEGCKVSMERTCEKNSNWRGGRIVVKGYSYILLGNHPRADHCGYAPEHVVMAEMHLGRFLNRKEVVHHINRRPSDNSPENLYVCINQAHHLLIQRIFKALEACGNPYWLSCRYCKTYDAPDRMVRYSSPSGTKANFHRECNLAYQRKKRADRLALTPPTDR